MTQYAYHPETREFIRTDDPADWMSTTTVAPPEFEPKTAGCFWRGDRWEIVQGEVPSDPAPIVVTMRQARLALLKKGLLASVNAAIANMPGDEGEAARIEWEYAQDVQRESELVTSLGQALELTPEQIDDLFVLAASL